MKRIKALLNQKRYQKLVTAIFFLVIVVSGIVSIVLSMEFVGVYDTTNEFAPQISRVLKITPNSTTRIIAIELPLKNNGSKLIRIEGYAFVVYLNDQLIAYRDTFGDIILAPGEETTIWENFTFTGDAIESIVNAELSEQWNWLFQYPMRAYVGAWLYVVFRHFIMPWTGVEEVS
ncbi:MAG: hypothetical protein ACFFCF_00450 [Promethearchaeota archaeon]